MDLEMAANMLEEDENVMALPSSYLGFGKFINALTF
jgi:hypothetical protein